MAIEPTASKKISSRAVSSMAVPNPMRDTLNEAWNYLFDPINPCVNLGIAQNDLMLPELREKIPACLEFQDSDLGYGSPHGSRQLRSLVGSLVTRHFETVRPVEMDHVLATTGAGAAVYFLTMAITNPGDSMFVVAPYYGNFDADVCLNTGVNIIPLYLHSTDDFSLDVDPAALDEAMDCAKAKGKKIKALMLTNPHNPLGRCMTRENIEKLLQFAKKFQLHFISDEIYALSTFSHVLDPSKPNAFVSVLSLPNIEDLIDPSMVHVIYGMSKDFCLNGLRVGFIFDQANPDLRDALKAAMQVDMGQKQLRKTLTLPFLPLQTNSIFSYMSTINDRLLCNLLSDEAWIDSFISLNRQRLANAYRLTCDLLTQNGISYHTIEAGIFLVVDVREIIARRLGGKILLSADDEKQIWKSMLELGAYISPGHIFHTRHAGLFRLTFTIDYEKLTKGISILSTALGLQ